MKNKKENIKSRSKKKGKERKDTRIKMEKKKKTK